MHWGHGRTVPLLPRQNRHKLQHLRVACGSVCLAQALPVAALEGVGHRLCEACEQLLPRALGGQRHAHVEPVGALLTQSCQGRLCVQLVQRAAQEGGRRALKQRGVNTSLLPPGTPAFVQLGGDPVTRCRVPSSWCPCCPGSHRMSHPGSERGTHRLRYCFGRRGTTMLRACSSGSSHRGSSTTALRGSCGFEGEG